MKNPVSEGPSPSLHFLHYNGYREGGYSLDYHLADYLWLYVKFEERAYLVGGRL